ncbi:MAG TPA: hypothetical protein VHD90_21995 [Phototrophicaceae bacterium]|nr:hypothetical protein [Phototrophicaceae bacterium]
MLLKSKKLRIGLGIFAALVLMVVIGGFALSRGYLIHFTLDDQTISRDQFYTLYEAAEQGQPINVYCFPNGSLGWLYVYEDRCFSTESAADAYMKLRDGSS